MNRAVFLSIALASLALSMIATNAAGNTSNVQIAVGSTCDQQIWPVFSNDCLLTIKGEKSERKFRVISY